MNRFSRITLATLSLVAFAALVPSSASAGGFFLFDRGVRAAGRGGAFVAGADDPGAMFYNPAGLSYSGRQLLLDASFPLLDANYTRVDGSGQRLPNVDVSQAPIPIPTLAYSDDFGLEKLSFGVGVWAPNAALVRWPGSLDGGPAPQRYSLIDMDGTLLVTAALGISYRPVPSFSIGATLGVHTGSFGATTTMSACDGAICTQPETPEYDVLTQFNLAFFVAPAVSVGAIYQAGAVRIGSSFDVPYTISGTSELRTRLPSAPFFEGATIAGPNGSTPTADVNVPMPYIFRAGIEVRPTPALRLETSFVLEGWKRQRSIDLVANDVTMSNLTAIGEYEIGAVRIPRRMNNVYSLRLGGEYTTGIATLRAGVSVESSSFDSEYLSVLTLDSRKLIASAGIGIEVTRGVFLDGVFAYSAMENVAVRDSRIPQPNPIRPASENPEYVGNGDYRMNAFLIGGGLRVNFDARRTEPAPAAPADETGPDPANAARGDEPTAD